MSFIGSINVNESEPFPIATDAIEEKVELLSQRHFLEGVSKLQSGNIAPLLLLGVCGVYQPDWRAFAVLIALHGVCLIAMFAIGGVLRRAADPTVQHIWWRLYGAGCFCSGALWGLSMLPVAPTLGTDISSTFVCVTIIVTVAINSLLTATRWNCFLLFLVGVIVFLLPQTLIYMEIIGPIPLLATITLGPALWILANAVWQQDRAMIRTRLENEELARKLAHALETAEYLANRDSLTGLYNRRAFEDVATRIYGEPPMNPVCLVLIDLDHFKSINDRFGHALGDNVLKACAKAICESMQPTDILGRGDGAAARWGGEEFLLLLPKCTLAQAIEIAGQLRVKLASLTDPQWPAHLSVSGSFGVACWAPQQDLHDCINNADQAMYRAKQMGRNRVEVSDGNVVAPSN